MEGTSFYKELQQKKKGLKILTRLIESVHKSSSLEEVYRVASDSAIELENVDMTLIYLVDEQRREAVLQAHRNATEDYVRRAGRVPYPKGAIWKANIERKPIYIADVDQDTIVLSAVRQTGMKSLLTIPISFGGKAVGTLHISSLQRNAFDEEDVNLLEIVAQQIEVAIGNAWQAEALRKARDELETRVRERTGELERVNKTLKESEEKFRVLTETANDAIISADSLGNIAYFNKGAEHIWGYSATELVGKPLTILMPERFHNAHKEGLKRFLSTGETRLIGKTIELVGKRKDGSEFPLELSLANWKTNEGTFFTGILRDVTERMKAEEALQRAKDELEIRVKKRTAKLSRANALLKKEIMERKKAESMLEQVSRQLELVLDSAGEGICGVDINGDISFLNPAAAKMFGYEAQEIIGKSRHSIIHHSRHDGTAYPWEECPVYLSLKDGTTHYVDNEVFWREDGTSFPVEYITAPVREGDKIVGAVVTFNDITERKRMEEGRLRLDKLESLGVLAGGIAHDFNNLLTGILTTISSAKIGSHTNSDVYENLTEAEKTCIQAKRLTQQLLTFSEGGAPVKKLTSIERIIRESVSLALRGSNVKCNISIEEGLWDAEVDQGQISQAITNVLINADQAMPQGGAINISVRNIDYKGDEPALKEGRYVRITVEDEGIGILQEHIARIFDPYFTTKQKRSGLGLAVAYSVIKNHNGYIDVESELGKGTKFYVYIPASLRRVVEERVEQKKTLSGKGRVLIMDDEAIIRKSVGKALSRLGYEVDYAKDGEEAIELYIKAKDESRAFDVVIMDLTIPGRMGGKEAIKRLISVDPQVKAIVSSGYSNDPVMSEYKEYGFRGVVSKPYTIDDLAETIRKVIDEV